MTTSFREWLDANSLETEEEQEELLDVLREENSSLAFQIERRGKLLFLTGAGITLILASPKAKAAFIASAEKEPVEDELESGFRRNMENPHA